MKFAELTLFIAGRLGRIMTSQAVSTYANQVVAFVIPWLILSRTGSAWNASIVAFAMGLASLVGILMGGLIIDRIGGMKMSVVADVLSFVTTAALATALNIDFLPLWFVTVSQAFGVFFDGPGTIAKNTLVPEAAQQVEVSIVRAMGLQQTFQNVAMFLGPISAGLLIGMFSEGITLLSASMLFLGCAFLMFSVKQQRSARYGTTTFQQPRQDMWDAIRFIVQDPFLGPMQLLGPLYAFVLMPIAAIIFPAWFVFAGQSPNILGIFLGIQALGGMIGGVMFAALAPRVSQQRWLVGSMAGYAFALASLYFIQPGSMLSFVAGFAVGMMSTGIMAIPYTAFYTRTPEQLLGRVNSLGAASGFLMVSISSLFFGWLVDVYSAGAAILVCAIVMGLLSMATLLLPFMKLLDEKQPPDATVKESEMKGV
jgi:MFS family permease